MKEIILGLILLSSLNVLAQTKSQDIRFFKKAIYQCFDEENNLIASVFFNKKVIIEETGEVLPFDYDLTGVWKTEPGTPRPLILKGENVLLSNYTHSHAVAGYVLGISVTCENPSSVSNEHKAE